MAVEAARVAARFRELYPASAEPTVVRAPGRVNLIGEHTDYNLGFVMPVAIGMACRAAAAPSGDQWIRVYAEDLGQGAQVHLDALEDARPRGDWSDYVIGVAREVARRGLPIEAMNMVVSSTVPQGAGLSSSAALEVAVAMALSSNVESRTLAELCQAAEIDFVGVPCGIMDQFASLFSEAGSAMLLDCRTLEHRSVKLPEGVALLAVDSRVKHSLGASAYRNRVAECAEAVRAIRVADRQVESLRDASQEHLAVAMPDVPRRRARHIVSENARVLAFAEASERNDPETMGGLMNASHESLTVDYEVSCAELDVLVEIATAVDGVYGARMTGAGFGGCIVVLVNKDAVERASSTILREYSGRCNVEGRIYPVVPSTGACRIV
ncbi:MAG: galactokinase [Bryobacteraceae bacterium]